ncbi:hypothetical protein G8A07_06925 [Roseateles sp. DAIF2]|uniref:hypothetical protein n=1 Tax=Roseateles sp. DAIF2 TaxID=2714952 RepID=UPI0018A27D40|nr:hypothetical protein [Roseateles sp. DAIF2]QPF72686.1 hypothetical protein G8A07_06925 [Roseateles sp. DAIF2]
MAVGITDLAHSLRKNSAASTASISLSHGQHLVCATLGHKSLTSFQAAQNAEQEPQSLDAVPHVVADYDLLVERAAELKLEHPHTELRKLMTAAFAERLPGTKLHSSYDGLAAEFHDLVQYAVFSDDRVNEEMANANYDGVDEVYLENDLEPDKATIEQPYTETMPVQVTLGLDLERPYSGHQIKCQAAVTTVRLGRRCFEAPEVEVLSAALDRDWGDEDDSAPVKTIAEALAEELGISVAEAEELADAESMELTGHSGESFSGYEFDFTRYASPKLAAKLMKKRGSLQLRVGPWFYDGVRNPDFPN